MTGNCVMIAGYPRFRIAMIQYMSLHWPLDLLNHCLILGFHQEAGGLVRFWKLCKKRKQKAILLMDYQLMKRHLHGRSEKGGSFLAVYPHKIGLFSKGMGTLVDDGGTSKITTCTYIWVILMPWFISFYYINASVLLGFLPLRKSIYFHM